jgi:hypothetical protein
MKIVVSMAAFIACGFSLNAQISATLSHLPDGRDEVRIRNNFAIGLVAFVVTAKRTPESAAESNSPILIYSDPLIEPASMPLLTNEERVVMSVIFEDRFGKRHLIVEEPIVTAGILADGTPTGDTALLARLISRRCNMLVAVETAREMLFEAGRRNVPRSQLVDQFRKVADSVSRWYLPQEQQIGRGLYQAILGKLKNLPAGEVGAPFPPSDFVAQETASLGLRRVALLGSQPALGDMALAGK